MDLSRLTAASVATLAGADAAVAASSALIATQENCFKKLLDNASLMLRNIEGEPDEEFLAQEAELSIKSQAEQDAWVSVSMEILSEIKADPIKFFKKCAYFLGEIIVPGGAKHFDAWLEDKETLVEFLDNQKRSIADEMAMGLAIGAKAVKANKRLQAMYKYVNFKYEAKLAGDCS